MKKAASQATEPAESNPISDADRERLLRDIYRLDMEKFKLFTEMLRRNALLKKAVIKHKKNNMDVFDDELLRF